MYHVYILYSPSADKYYVGQTSDLELRLQYHNELNPDSYTSKHRPWELCRAIAVADQAHAIRLERAIKKRSDGESWVNDKNPEGAVLRGRGNWVR